MSNIRVGGRIAIATILPLLAFAGFAANGLLEKWSTYRSAGRVAAVRLGLEKHTTTATRARATLGGKRQPASA